MTVFCLYLDSLVLTYNRHMEGKRNLVPERTGFESQLIYLSNLLNYSFVYSFNNVYCGPTMCRHCTRHQGYKGE